MESHKSDWERVNPTKPLGGGGQSDVYLVRTPERTKQRARSLQFLDSHVPTAISYTTAEEKSNLNILKAFQSLVRTVSLLHKEGIVHRDIKPANVFVRKDHELS